MKKATSLLVFLCTFLFGILSASCSSDDQPLIESSFDIDQDELEIGFTKTSSSTLITVNTTLPPNQWKVTSTDNWCTAEQSKTDSGTAIKISVTANNDKKTRTTTVTVQSNVKTHIISVSQHGTETSLETVKDIRVFPGSGKASEANPGCEIEYTWDKVIGGDKHYHSIWEQKANFPVILEYFFNANKNEEIDYFIYYPRNGNGNFGKFDLYVSTNENPHYTKYGSYDFKMKNASQRVNFEGGLKGVRNIKLEVHSGLNDFVSCDEMEFLKKAISPEEENQQNALLLNVFSDLSCSELKTEANDRQIALLPAFYADLAMQLKNGTYPEQEKRFRAATYQPYSIVEDWANKLMTKKYSNLDNPTGICVEPGDELTVLVSDTHGQSISLQCIGEEDAGGYKQVASNGDDYHLEKGANKLVMRSSGQLFVMYNTDITSPEAKPVRIHFTPGSGKVTGFFDLKTDKTDKAYTDLLAKATHKYFCVRGEKIIFYFHTAKMREHVNNEISSAIHLWDDIIGWQQELMGIEDVRPSQVNNHLFAISPEGSYMWASDYRIAFVDWKLGDILLKDNVMKAKDNAWGPAHEIGHIHQAAINWAGSTESSNNLFSNFILYKLGKYCSRGTELNLPKADENRTVDGDGNITSMTLSEAHCVLNRPWCNFGSNYQGENTELHMRMNWQLWNYYHRCGYKPDFWQKLFKLMRENRTDSNNPGVKQLLFARMACEAAQEDLTEFFEMWGFFVPVDILIEQYGNYQYTVTENMIKETKKAMAKYPKKAKPFYYLEDRQTGDEGLDTTPPDIGNYSQFQTMKPVTNAIKGRINGREVAITNGKDAVAFELRDTNENGKLLYFSTFFNFEIPLTVPLTYAKLYAVQADGKRILLSE